MARQEEQTDVKEQSGKGSKKIMIIAGAVVMSAALVGGGVFFALNGHNASAGAEAGADKPAEKKAEPAKKKEAPTMYPLEAFIVNISDGQDMRYLKVKVELETALPTEAAKKEMDPYLAPLRDSILVLLTTKTIQDVQDLPGKNRIKEEILAAAKKVIPAGKISSVYFTDFVVQ
jgi:flagellar FliL protein